MKHTPGPWHRFEDKNGHSRVGNASNSIALVENILFGPAENAANAQLIAASPIMLEALENALEAFNEKYCNCDGEYVDGRIVGHACYFHRIEGDLRRAIKKATGEK